MNSEYKYNFLNGKFWIEISNKLPVIQEEPVTEKKVEYISSTGQFISNCYFFIEGIDSENIKTKLSEIYDTLQHLDKISDIKHLENQDFIATYIFKYVQSQTCNYEILSTAVNYLLQVSLYLAQKIGLKIENQKSRSNENLITRCSYKFCHYTYYCNYNYPEDHAKQVKGCYSDHYVHNKLAQDLQSLLYHIKTKYENVENINVRSNQEVIKCINTITFVIKHMYDELWNIYISTDKNNYEIHHKNILQ